MCNRGYMLTKSVTRMFCEAKTTNVGMLTFDNLLSDGYKEKCMETIRGLPHLPEMLRGAPSPAAVLAALCVHKDGRLSMLYTLRASHLKSHSGQVSFPGGKFDADDGNLTNTALRETEEELGIPRQAVEVWGTFNSGFPSRNYEMTVTPVVGLIRDFDSLKLVPNPNEVEDVFTVPLEVMCDRQYFGFNKFENGYTIPVYMGGRHKIWGLTALVSHLLLSCLLPESMYPMRFEYMSVPQARENNKPKL